MSAQLAVFVVFMILIAATVGGILISFGAWQPRLHRERSPLHPEPDDRPPHEQYPELLEWKAGDEIDLLTEPGLKGLYVRRVFVSVSQDGTVYYRRDNYYDKELKELPLKQFMKGVINVRIKQEQLNKRVADAKEYQAVLSDTRKALEEAGITLKKY